jgi:hypothetical protein
MNTLSGITNRLINVDFLTTDYRIVGKVLVGNSGLFGLLTDSTRTFLEVRQAQIAYTHQPNRLVLRLDNALVVKNRIFAACMERREDIGPVAIAHRGYTQYQRYPLHVGVAEFEIKASLEWTGRFDLAAVVAENATNFVPAYSATITSPVLIDFAIQSEAILINFVRIDMVALDTQKTEAKKPAEV